MKKSLFSLCFLSLLFDASAQTQQGYVKTKGRLTSNGTVIQGTRLSGAMVTVKGRNAVLSGSNGTFALSIPSNSYYLQNVQKQGYIITDPDVLSRQYSYSKNPLVLVLENKEQRTEDKLLVERKIRRNLQHQLQQREDEIETLKEQNKITKLEYQERLKKLYDEQQSNEKLISDMAERYAKIDYDQMDGFNTLITKYILDGELTKADSLLKTKGDINTRFNELRQLQEQNAKDELELAKRKKKLERNKTLMEKEMEDIAQDCYSKFEIFKIQHQNDSAAYFIGIRAELDTMNVIWQNEAGSFFEKYCADFNNAMRYYKRALAVSANLFGPNSVMAAIASNNIGSLFVRMENFNNGLEFLQRALDIKLHNIGQDQVNIATTYNNIGSTLAEQGKIDKALEYYEKALESCILADSKLEISGCYNNIGAIYYKQGKYKESIEYFKKALTMRQELFGEIDFRVASCYRNIGSVYSKISDLSSALFYNKKALEIDCKVLGEQHPNTANSYNNLGQVYENQKRFDEALDCYWKAIEINRRIYGERNTIIATNYNNIGMVYSKSGDYQNAEEYLKKAYDIQKEIKGESHPDAAMTYNNLGGVYMKKGDYPKALECRLHAIDLLKKSLGENHPNVALCYNNIAVVYMKLENYSKAIEYYKMAYDIFFKVFGPDHKNTQLVKDSIEKIPIEQR